MLSLAAGRSRLPVAMAAMGFESLRNGQKEIIDMLMAGRDILCILPTGGGKCLALNTPVRMFDGTTKMSQDIVPGDKLLGPDGLARIVTSICKGREEMFRITPHVGGTPYTVNRSHILSLLETSIVKGESPKVVNMCVVDYLSMWFWERERYRGWRGRDGDILSSYKFHIRSVGIDDYYGFELEGSDKLFLLGDFTVTHNTACFVLPALSCNWPTIIFSPLTALMRDQVQSLQRVGIAAGELSGLKSVQENQMTMEQWAMGELQFLYAAPERMSNPKFMELMQIRKPTMLVVDECFTPDVEILTENGFVQFDQLQEGVRCAQFNADDQTIDLVIPDKLICKDYEGDLVRLQSKRLCDLDMTPNHELLAIRPTGAIKVPAKLFSPNSCNRFYAAGKHAGGIQDKLTPLERLHIAFQADGNLHNSYADGKSFSMSFTFIKERKIKRFLEIMEQGQFLFHECKVDPRKRRRFIVQNIPHASKLLSDNLKLSDMSWQRAREFVEEMVCWDGSVIKSHLYYYSSKIKANSDFIQAAAVMAGYKTYLTKQVDNRKVTFSDMHRLFIDKSTDTIGTQNIEKTSIPYSGKVYCVRVPSGNIVVRRNGKVVVVGNCHCLSTWGDSFREHYKFLGDFVRDVNPQVVAAFSATIPDDAEAEIREVLGIKQATRMEFYNRRSNLILSSEDYPGDDAFVGYVVNTKGPTIVYCTSIKRVEQYASLISNATDDLVAVYHGDMDPTAKRTNMDMFMKGTARIVVATNAFGMGIDKANIRNVIHRDIPKSSEACLQELGRGGRDGNTSWCKMFYSAKSLDTAKFFVKCENPTEGDVKSVFRALETLSSVTPNILISQMALGQMCGLHDSCVPAVLTRLKAAKVIERSTERPTIAGADFVAGFPHVPKTFAETRDAIYANVLETKGDTLMFDLLTVAEELGVADKTLRGRLSSYQKDGYMKYYPPFRGAPMRIVGSIQQVDFNKLREQARVSEEKLQQVLDYHATPDDEKHAFLETIFGTKK